MKMVDKLENMKIEKGQHTIKFDRDVHELFVHNSTYCICLQIAKCVINASLNRI
jgi:hypothetical protein